MSKPLLIAALSLLGGCALTPDAARIELEHVSHPLAGWPVGPRNEEDGLSQASVILDWRGPEGWYIQQGLGYNLEGDNGGGFYGPAFTYTGRVGYEFNFHGSK